MPSHDPAQTVSVPGGKLPSWMIILLMLGLVGIALWQNNHAAQPGPFEQNSAESRLPDDKSPTEPQLTPEDGTEAHDVKKDAASVQGAPQADTKKTDAAGSSRSPQTLRSVDPKTFPDPRTNAQTAPGSEKGRGPLSGMRNKPASGNPSSATSPPFVDRNRPTQKQETASKPDPASKSEKSAYLVENQTIRDLYGRVVYKGAVDLKPTLDRIERGEANNHRNDGSSFQNREGRLPRKPAGYYKEYVHPTKGEYGPGPQRIILGKEGEVWYTPDHYKSFKKIK